MDQQTSSIQIIKSPSDKRQYRHLTLDNGMQAIVVSDSEADKSAASLDVRVGCSLDPKPLYGTAHFLEHMLFMGTEKYPSENEYTEFIKNNGGSDNAYTSLTDTNYYFDISNEAFAEALDRFSQFFKKPLLGESSAEREMKAVDSEFNQSLQSDAWRFFALIQDNANPDSLLHRFNCGNMESLKQEGIRESLLDFHKKWYSSNIMRLSVVSNKDLDTLEKQVRELFAEVPNKDVVVPDLGDPVPLRPEDLGNLYKFVPIKDKDIITIAWVLPYVQKEYKTRPLQFWSHLFGHEGENSLLSYLIAEGLALELSSYEDHELWSFSTFYVDITLTKKGIENVNKVIEAVFQYAKILKERGVQDYIYQEIKRIGEINFEFADKQGAQGYALKLASRMQYFEGQDLEYILRSQYGILEQDKPRLEEIINQINNPANVNIFIRSKSFEAECDKVETWYKTKYSRTAFSEELLKLMTQPNSPQAKKKLDLPPPNNLLPQNLEVLPESPQHADKPTLIQVWEDCDLWYLKDDKFKRPKAMIDMKIYTNDCMYGRTPQGRVFVDVWNSMVKEYLREFYYTASVAEMDTNTCAYHDNINIHWKGYNDTLPTFVEETLKRIKAFKASENEDIFNQVKEKLLQEWYNFYYEPSYRQGIANFENILLQGAYEKRTLRALLEKFTFQDLVELSQKWLISGRTLWFVSGNITKDVTIKMVEKSREILGMRPVDKEDLVDIRCVALPAGVTQLLEVPLEDKTNENSCMFSYFEAGLEGNDLRNRLIHKVVMQYMDEPTFNQLRTIEQLGYVVFARSSQYRDVQGAQIIVQSPQQCCEYIGNSINVFLNVQREKVQNLSDEDFKTQVESVMVAIAEKDYNLAKVHYRFWNEIATHKYIFDRQDKEIEILKSLTKEEFQKHFEQLFFTNRKRLDYEMTSEKHQNDQQEWKLKNLAQYYGGEYQRNQVTTTLSTFKKQMPLHPDNFKADYANFKL